MVEKRHIDPSKVLLITFTRKAANELHDRMNIEGMTCSTFHALAYHIIAQVTGQAPSICDGEVPLNVFQKLILNNPDFLHSINNYIINQQSLMGLEHDYTDASHILRIGKSMVSRLYSQMLTEKSFSLVARRRNALFHSLPSGA